MNIFQSAWQVICRQPISSVVMVLLLGITTALGYSITAVERGFRQSSARAADGFDLLVGAPGSSNALLLGTVFLRATALDALPQQSLTAILADSGVRSAAPLAFGDTTPLGPLVGTTSAFFSRGKNSSLAEGRLFNLPNEAVVGYHSSAVMGSKFRPIHIDGDASEDPSSHAFEFTVVGRMQKTGTPWDSATLVPIEAVAKVHFREIAAAQVLVISPRNIADAYRLRHSLRNSGLLAAFPAELLVELDALADGPRFVLKAGAVLLQSLVLCGVLFAMVVFVRHEPSANDGFRRTWLIAFGLTSAGIATGLATSWLFVPMLAKALSNWLGMEITGGVSMTELQIVLAQLGVVAAAAVLPALARPKR